MGEVDIFPPSKKRNTVSGVVLEIILGFPWMTGSKTGMGNNAY